MKLSAYQKKWRKENPERVKDYVLKWRRNNAEKHKAYVKKWTKENRERLKLQNKIWRRKNRERYYQMHRLSKLKTTYGITLDDVKRLYAKQHGECAICREALSFATRRGITVDHCHRTSTVRGLLCSRCNLGLGYWRDNVELLKNGIQYLRNDKYWISGSYENRNKRHEKKLDVLVEILSRGNLVSALQVGTEMGYHKSNVGVWIKELLQKGLRVSNIQGRKISTIVAENNVCHHSRTVVMRHMTKTRTARAVCGASSIALQYGVPVDELFSKFIGTRFEPSGAVKGVTGITRCTSPLDLIGRYLISKFSQTIHIVDEVGL